MDADKPQGYRIGTVGTLTGLDPHTIRAWERRYDAVKPLRTSAGARLYDDRAVERLQLLKAVVDCGEAISAAAKLTDAELRARLDTLSGLAEGAGQREAVAGPLRLGLLAPVVAGQVRAQAGGMAGFELVIDDDRREAFVEALGREPCDVLVIELERLGSEPLRSLEKALAASGARLAVVIYTFASRSDLARLSRRGAKLVRGPLRVDQLRRAILDLVAIDMAGQPRAAAAATAGESRSSTGAPEARIFSDEQLARLAEVGSAIDCECPNHLAALVNSLLAFEDYSNGCESRTESDMALHARLAIGTGRARGQIERLLVELCDYEGIRV